MCVCDKYNSPGKCAKVETPCMGMILGLDRICITGMIFGPYGLLNYGIRFHVRRFDHAKAVAVPREIAINLGFSLKDLVQPGYKQSGLQTIRRQE